MADNVVLRGTLTHEATGETSALEIREVAAGEFVLYQDGVPGGWCYETAQGVKDDVAFELVAGALLGLDVVWTVEEAEC